VVTGGWRATSDGLRLMVSDQNAQEAQDELNRLGLQERVAHTARVRATARRAGFDEAILLDADGGVMGCTGPNLFLVEEGVVYTSPASQASHDVARHTALTLLQDLGYPVVEEQLNRSQLDSAGEAFLCSTASEIVPASHIDARALTGGKGGPVTGMLQRLYADTTLGRGRRSRGWLEYVMMEPLF
jgi:branched-chain amino acid aminotransferase